MGRRGEPRFDHDFAYGRDGELRVNRIVNDILDGSEHVETKRKSYKDLIFYVETHCDFGRRGAYVPSGISTTGAEYWAYVIDDTGIVLCLPVDLLRAMERHPNTHPGAENDGDNPTRGYLVNLGTVMRHLRGEP